MISLTQKEMKYMALREGVIKRVDYKIVDFLTKMNERKTEDVEMHPVLYVDGKRFELNKVLVRNKIERKINHYIEARVKDGDIS